MPLDRHAKNSIHGSNPGVSLPEQATVTTPMITPILLCARSLGEPDTGILHAGISKGATGQRAVQSKWRGR